MNDKQKELNRILDVTVECCTFDDSENILTITRDDVLGKSRKQNIVMTRCMVAMNILSAGFSYTTTANFLNRTEKAIRDMVNAGQNLTITSKAFRIANAESVLKLKDDR